MKQCATCKAKNKNTANFCASCGGNAFIEKSDRAKNKKVLIGVIVCIVIGVLSSLGSADSSSSTQTAASAPKITFDYSAPSVNTTSATTTAYTQPTNASSYYTTAAPATSFAVREIPLTADFQHHMNSFLSRYSETDMQNFSTPDAVAMSRFGVRYTYIQQNDKWEKLTSPVTIGGKTYNCRIEKQYVGKAILNHFCFLTLVPDFHDNKPDYYDGYYYHNEMGGMDMDDLTVVTRVMQVDEREFEVYFNLYDVAANNRNMYHMNNEQVLAEMTEKPFIRYVGNGKAVIESYDIYNVSASRLSEYYIYY